MTPAATRSAAATGSAAALARARRHGKVCPIALAKLDRLSRYVHYISGLMAPPPVRQLRTRLGR